MHKFAVQQKTNYYKQQRTLSSFAQTAQCRRLPMERGERVCGDVVLLDFWCGFAGMHVFDWMKKKPESKQ